MSSAANIARALGGHRNGEGFLVRCPVPSHGQGRGDRRPSLSIRDGDDRLLVRCFAGCDPRDVLAELRRRGLLDDDGALRCDRQPALGFPPPARRPLRSPPHRGARRFHMESVMSRSRCSNVAPYKGGATLRYRYTRSTCYKTLQSCYALRCSPAGIARKEIAMIEAACVGRLTNDIAVRTSQGGKRFASVAIAVGNGDATQWLRVALFGDKAGQAAGEVKRDDLVYVEGRLRLENWTARDGTARTSLAISASRFEASTIGRRRPAKPRASSPRPAAAPAPDPPAASEPFFNDEIGF